MSEQKTVMDQSQYEINELRILVKKSLNRNLFESAALLCERLSTLSGNVSDYVLYANCYYRGNQYRRCLAILELKGYLSAAVVTEVGKYLCNDSIGDAGRGIDFEGTISAIELAAQCLYGLEQYEDCVSLLQPLTQLNNNESQTTRDMVARLKALFHTFESDTNPMTVLYCILGKCYDMLQHSSRAMKALSMALRLDISCIEAAQYLVDRSLLTTAAKAALYQELSTETHSSWLMEYYTVLLLDRNPTEVLQGIKVETSIRTNRSAAWLARMSEHLFRRQDIGESYRLSRQAYTMDPYDQRALCVYVATMVHLKLKTELFYLGHELVNSFPKKAMSWYTIGCYYWCCDKFELAQKHLVKATKLDKRCSEAWILLGLVLAALEESEQSIAAFRTAARLLPGEHMPLVCMAKELVRAHHLAPALHILSSALDICPDDPGLLNELGVTYLKQGSMDLALQFFGKAVHAVDASVNRSQSECHSQACSPSIAFTFRAGCSSEIFSNYATALRRCERFEEALYWYDKCMATSPTDANCHASVGFTFHLMQRFDMAVSSYHQALAIQPNLTFCSDMLSRAMEDMSYFPSVLSADPATDSDHHGNLHSLSKYGVGVDPLESGEMDTLAGANASLYAGVPARYAEESYLSMQLSEMHSPGLSMAQSFSRIEGRLSLTPRAGGWQNSGGDYEPSCATPSDHGGYLNESFE